MANINSKSFIRTIKITEVKRFNDKNGNPYANIRGDLITRGEAAVGKDGGPVNVFSQAFGPAYAKIESAGALKEGQIVSFYGFSQRREADEANGITPVRSFIALSVQAINRRAVRPTSKAAAKAGSDASAAA